MTLRPLLCTTLTIALVALFGCSGKDIDESNPKELYEDAQSDIESDRYQLALDKLRVVKNKFPYSNYSIEAQLRIADVYFLQESFAEAAANYETFIELHPKHEKVPYASYRIGEAYMNDAPSNVARDQSSTKKALDAYQAFVTRYPADGRVADAKKHIEKILSTLAEKQFYIGDWYYGQDAYPSAEKRFQKLIADYPSSENIPEAKEKLQASSKYLDDQAAEKHPVSGAYFWERYRPEGESEKKQ